MRQRIATRTETIEGSESSIIRARLIEQRRFRIDQLEELSGEPAGANDTSAATRREVAQVLEMAAESALAEIDAALKRLADGSYGTCERCVKTIAPERLEVLPSVPLCTNCQYLTESGSSWRPRTGRATSSVSTMPEFEEQRRTS